MMMLKATVFVRFHRADCLMYKAAVFAEPLMGLN